jgi:sugar phosphate isomerase/epimerase
MTLENFAVHTITTKPWTLDECIENFAREGFGGISVWRDALTGRDPATARRRIADAGLSVVSLVRGGFFTSPDPALRKLAIEENRAVLRQAEALGAPAVVLVCGATPGQLPLENIAQIEEAIEALIPEVERTGVRLSIEPLHPMYAADRSAIVSLRDANSLAASIGHPAVGVAIDVFHVWWESDLEYQIQRCAEAGHLHAYHICDFLPAFSDPLNDRGLMGEGAIPLRPIDSWIRAAGFRGLAEVEIFSHRWWAHDQHDYLKKIAAACRTIYQDRG